MTPRVPTETVSQRSTSEVEMNPKRDEWMAVEHGDSMRRDAAGSQLLARARHADTAVTRQATTPSPVRRLIERLHGLRRRARMDASPRHTNPR
jgi:hypothetical protein